MTVTRWADIPKNKDRPSTPSLRRRRSGFDPETGGRLWISDSAMKTVATCGTQTALHYAMHRTTIDQKVAMDVGIILHEADATFMKLGGHTRAALETLEFGYKEHDLMGLKERRDGSLDPRRFDNVRVIAEEWWTRRHPDRLPYEVIPEWVEVPFAVPLWDDDEAAPIYFGVMDAVVRNKADGYLYVRDLKTTGFHLTDDRFWRPFELSTQGSGYCFAAKETLGEPVSGFLIDALHLGNLPGSDRKCKTHPEAKSYAECAPLHIQHLVRDFSRRPEQIKEWHREADRLADDFASTLRFMAGQYGGKPWERVGRTDQRGLFNGGCNYCDFREYCKGCRRPEDGPIMTIEEDR